MGTLLALLVVYMVISAVVFYAACRQGAKADRRTERIVANMERRR